MTPTPSLVLAHTTLAVRDLEGHVLHGGRVAEAFGHFVEGDTTHAISRGGRGAFVAAPVVDSKSRARPVLGVEPVMSPG